VRTPRPARRPVVIVFDAKGKETPPPSTTMRKQQRVRTQSTAIHRHLPRPRRRHLSPVRARTATRRRRSLPSTSSPRQETNTTSISRLTRRQPTRRVRWYRQDGNAQLQLCLPRRDFTACYSRGRGAAARVKCLRSRSTQSQYASRLLQPARRRPTIGSLFFFSNRAIRLKAWR